MNIQLKRIIQLVPLLFIFISNIIATPRNSREALRIAMSFYQKNPVSTKSILSGTSTLKLAYTCSDVTTRSSDSNGYYYVFNIGNNNGFVIISGDDRAKDILGYSNVGSFNIDSLPPNFSDWLKFYKNELKYLVKQPEQNNASLLRSYYTSDNTLATYAAFVNPLLEDNRWDQGYPYNNLCPVMKDSIRAVTGCVATAMSQVMKYHRWPLKGTGSNRYIPSGFTDSISVDFSQTTYDWENMTDIYNKFSTKIQIDAVAKLMYHTGVAVNMNYGLFSSSAYPTDMAKALIKNFGYDSRIQLYNRDYYSQPEWVDLLKSELIEGRPILYFGRSEGYGHEFVCDGYDKNGLFHFNWGWSGDSNGYFELSVLNPNSLGVSGGTSGGFNYNQKIVIGIKKASSSYVIAPYQLHLYSPLVSSSNLVSRTGSFLVSTDFYNMGINTFNGSIGIALYNDKGMVYLLQSQTVSFLETNYGFASFSFNTQIPVSISNGNYKMYYVFKPAGDSNWQIMRGKVGTPNYLNITVTNSNISVTTPDLQPKLILNSFNVTGNLYQNKTGRFNLSITNNGEEYNSNIIIRLQLIANDTVIQKVCSEPVNIPAGKSKNVELVGDVLLSPGTYYLSALYDLSNDRLSSENYNLLGNSMVISLLPEPTELPVITLSSKINFQDSTKVSKDNVILKASIKNIGGFLNSYIAAVVFPKLGGISLSNYGFQSIILDKNEEKEVTFQGSLDLDPGEYLTVPYFWDSENYEWKEITPRALGWLTFILVDNIVGAEQNKTSKVNLYPNPATDVLFLQSDNIVESIQVIDMSGKVLLLLKPMIRGEIEIPVERLSSGMYTLRVETDKGVTISKFIKK